MEEWKEIFSNYHVSTLGNVDSTKYKSRRRLKQWVNQNGYLFISLYFGNKRKHYAVHHLVALAFVPKVDGKSQINHINGIKTDNRVENLEWVTPSENTLHAVRTGLKPVGEKHYKAKLTNAEVQLIRENPQGLSIYELASLFGVHAATVSKIQIGKAYKNAGGTTRKTNKHTKRLSDEVRNQIRGEYIKGSKNFNSRALAKKYNVDPKTILNIVHGK